MSPEQETPNRKHQDQWLLVDAPENIRHEAICKNHNYGKKVYNKIEVWILNSSGFDWA